MDLSKEDNKLLLNNIKLLDLNENLTYLTFFSYKLSFASNVVNRINYILLYNDCYILFFKKINFSYIFN